MSQIYLEKCNICFIPFIALKRNILENSDFVLLKEDIHRLISSIELFLRDIRGQRYADFRKVKGTDIKGGDRHNRWGQTYDQISKC